jgi:hypothetical protein
VNGCTFLAKFEQEANHLVIACTRNTALQCIGPLSDFRRM